MRVYSSERYLPLAAGRGWIGRHLRTQPQRSAGLFVTTPVCLVVVQLPQGHASGARAMKRVRLLLVVTAATILAGCQPVRFGQCDSANVPGANCYQQQGPPYRN
jgi:hypothetical protein